jgi:hypothetical protein
VAYIQEVSLECSRVVDGFPEGVQVIRLILCRSKFRVRRPGKGAHLINTDDEGIGSKVLRVR